MNSNEQPGTRKVFYYRASHLSALICSTKTIKKKKRYSYLCTVMNELLCTVGNELCTVVNELYTAVNGFFKLVRPIAEFEIRDLNRRLIV
jgi:hypothetical protein